ncbi:MAG: uracil-DNA glycosylase [Rhodocyclaceae bacterium]|nr:uracil-DNA glycosylase [Rhodocyclaceae bacterium]
MNPRRAAMLREMGFSPLWRLRGAPAPDMPAPLVAVAPGAAEQGGPAAAPGPAHAAVVGDAPPPVRQSVPPPTQQLEQRAAPARGAEPAPPPRVARPSLPAAAPAPLVPDDAARVRNIGAMDWDALHAEIAGCRACGLCEKRKQAVPGVGDRAAEWLFVGEGPGADEDERGEPFVGQAGKLLDAMLGALGIARGQGVYIANAVKCRPPNNRTPEAPEIAACNPFLQRQIALIRPRIIVALGRPAAQALLGSEVKISEVRGKVLQYGDIPLVVTYHPAYLLRNLPDKSKAWADLCFARDTVRRSAARA